MRNGQKWTAKEEEYLLKVYRELPYKQIADILGRSINAVTLRLNRIRDKGDYRAKRKHNQRPWTAKELDFLIKNHGKLSYIRIAIELNRSYDTVKRRYEYWKSTTKESEI